MEKTQKTKPDKTYYQVIAYIMEMIKEGKSIEEVFKASTEELDSVKRLQEKAKKAIKRMR